MQHWPAHMQSKFGAHELMCHRNHTERRRDERRFFWLMPRWKKFFQFLLFLVHWPRALCETIIFKISPSFKRFRHWRQVRWKPPQQEWCELKWPRKKKVFHYCRGNSTPTGRRIFFIFDFIFAAECLLVSHTSILFSSDLNSTARNWQI